jgi:uncharacterized protein YcbK (DUF882 family)
VLDIYYSTLKIVTQAYTFLLEFEGGGVGYYYPTLEIVGVDNDFISPMGLTQSQKTP